MQPNAHLNQHSLLTAVNQMSDMKALNLGHEYNQIYKIYFLLTCDIGTILFQQGKNGDLLRGVLFLINS